MTPNPRFSFPDSAPEGAIDPADCNSTNDEGSWLWVETVLAPIGLTLVCVEMKYSEPELQKVGPQFPELIGAEIFKHDFGHFDSLKKGDPFKIYYHLYTASL